MILNVNAYIKEEHIMLIDIFLNMHKFRESILDSFYMCFVIIKNGEIVEPLFDFDDVEILVLIFLIKLFSVSEMTITLKAKTSLRVLKIQHPEDGFESHKDRIQISISKSFRKFARANVCESLMQWIRISIPECLRKFAQTYGFESPSPERIKCRTERLVSSSFKNKLLSQWLEVH